MQRLKEYTFDPHLALCKSFALQIKFFDIEGGRKEEVLSKTLSALNYATKTDAASTHALHDVLDALNSWVDVFSRHPRLRRVPFFRNLPQHPPILLPAALERGLHSWVLHAKDKHTVDTVRGTSGRPRNMNHAMPSLPSTAAQSLVRRRVGDSGQTCAEPALTDVELSDSDMPCAIGSLPHPVLNKMSKRREAIQRKRWRIKQRLKRNASSPSEEEI
jgi:hypothetical protein